MGQGLIAPGLELDYVEASDCKGVGLVLIGLGDFPSIEGLLCGVRVRGATNCRVRHAFDSS